MVFDNKFLATLIGISLAFLAANNFNQPDDIKENFLGTLPSFTTKVVKDVKCVPKQSSDMYMVPGTYQSNIAPRFSNTNYGANINYNIPCRDVLATPVNPVPMVSVEQTVQVQPVVDEGFCIQGQCNQAQLVEARPLDNCCSTDIYPGASYAAGDFNQVSAAAYDPTEYPDVQSMIPSGTLDSLGESCQPIVYDRYIYANRNSRLRSQGDPIRGDLPIVPCNTGWFRPSAHPQIDLQQGALNVIAGVSNETTQQMNELITASSGGAVTVNAGVPMSQMFPEELCAGQNDVIVTAYP